IISELDLVCVMSVNPGFGGQKFIENTYEKVRQLTKLIQQHNANVLIEIDGGVTSENAAQLVLAGANVLVAGSFVFSSQSPKETIQGLQGLVNG
ncbi:MAG: ribulose-phosphate 3-epimerase, partial [Flavobacteriaceae bacterium]